MNYDLLIKFNKSLKKIRTLVQELVQLAILKKSSSEKDITWAVYVNLTSWIIINELYM